MPAHRGRILVAGEDFGCMQAYLWRILVFGEDFSHAMWRLLVAGEDFGFDFNRGRISRLYV